MMVRYAILGIVVTAAILALAIHSPVAQDPRYHDFADRRRLLGVPNFWNVVSNLPFFLVGVTGLFAVHRAEVALSSSVPAYYAFFLAVVGVSVGSAWYHLSPSDERLAWDRLPMALAFMALLTIVIGERVDDEVARALFPGLLALGAASVAQWRLSKPHGRGDLRLYLLVQFLSLILIAFITVLFPARFAQNATIWGMLAAYATAKMLEGMDRRIFALGLCVSGHTLKHLVAAAGVYLLVLALRSK